MNELHINILLGIGEVFDLSFDFEERHSQFSIDSPLSLASSFNYIFNLQNQFGGFVAPSDTKINDIKCRHLTFYDLYT